jgi:hypothetical protein
VLGVLYLGLKKSLKLPLRLGAISSARDRIAVEFGKEIEDLIVPYFELNRIGASVGNCGNCNWWDLVS